MFVVHTTPLHPRTYPFVFPRSWRQLRLCCRHLLCCLRLLSHSYGPYGNVSSFANLSWSSVHRLPKLARLFGGCVISSDRWACYRKPRLIVKYFPQIPLAGDIRPYFTMQDVDHSSLVNKLPPKAGLLLGVTNPFFEKSCGHWPHILSLGRRRMYEGPFLECEDTNS